MRKNHEGWRPSRCSDVPVPSGGPWRPWLHLVGPISSVLLRLIDLGDDAEVSSWDVTLENSLRSGP